MNKDFEVVSAKTIMKARNIEIRYNGWLFDIVYWQRENDWFVAVPNHNVSTIINNPADSIYTMGRLSREFLDETKTAVIAQAIKEDYEEWRKENESKN